MNGIVNVFKPKDMTSHDVVNIMRKVTGIKRIGHTGTLDPMATGVLPICIGKATRVSEYLLNLDKEYVADLTLGQQTDTLDAEGKIINRSDKVVNEKEVRDVIDNYVGDILQTPPMYSALKFKGKKLYELAREGKNIERPKRKVKIHSIDILNIYNNKKITLKVNCSRGTYIRSLCDDIGLDLGTFGHMSYLMRTRAGSFEIQDSYSLEFIKKLNEDKIKEILIPMDKSLDHIDNFSIDDKYYDKLINGIKIKLNCDINFKEDKQYKVYCKDVFIGIGTIIRIDLQLFMKMNKVLLI